MEPVAKEFEKVLKRQRTLRKESNAIIDTLVLRLTDMRAAAAAAAAASTPDAAAAASANDVAANETKELATRLTDSYKDAQSAIYKYSKAVDKRFKVDLDAVWDPQAFDGKEQTLHRSLAIHFIREGRFDMAQVFMDETGVQVPANLKSQFFEMFQIQEALRARDIRPAISWATSHRADLEKKGSSLEFRLHKMQFLQYLAAHESQAALVYAKANFSFFPRHLKEIQKLMCSILFMNRISKSPYASLLDTHYWTDIQTSFARDFCLLLGLSSDSPLYISVTAGTSALPTMIKMASIMKDKSGIEWSQQGELPVEVALADAYRFHSVFACPVSKEQGTEVNPAMMMLCGHVVCKESLMRVCKGNLNARFKCPYCPTESTAAQAMRVYF